MVNYEDKEIIKVPRFNEVNGFYTTKSRSILMSKIKSKNTRPEILFRKALWASGIRFRLHNKALPGNPDIVINKYKIIVFIDGEFWHGYEWDKKRAKIKSNREFWIAKIERNMQRDEANNLKLKLMGYTVIRFWEKQIKKDVLGCVKVVSEKMEGV
ncbi:very short patch repair endonuclease [Mucilaginibacter terrae]|uniref:DNA mismatch endonuclease (Patch repair protein) n=1 Tax=Mucilaginibacter terrae TaxID=1955052 RepID=A0ABU3GQM9_9SPHI|nr:very short patch repair endonuclease [Mucilaginibacter terrae]MDT3402092.1 DNA mismatch endonuclease (patch repair protein) [Mucilaginibacter terrae]